MADDPSSPLFSLPAAPLILMAELLTSKLAVLIDPGREAERGPFLRSLRPIESDYSRVFVADAVERARAFYDAMWSKDAGPATFDPRRTVLKFHVAVPEDFLSSHPRAAAFPRGYRSVANKLLPGVPWACFELLEPGETLGLSTDGLVLVDDRLLWFPRPFLALGFS